MKRIAVTGGRHYRNRRAVQSALERVYGKHGPFILVHGGATGADALAAVWAVRKGLELVMYAADWKRYGRRAGPLRNRAMVDSGLDGLVAFPGGRGTADMTRAAISAGVPVWAPVKPVCPGCKGQGDLRLPSHGGDNQDFIETDCPTCKGTGVEPWI